MAQHFLLSAKARTLSLTAICRMSDDEAHAAFVAIRWAATGGEPVCPRCGCMAVYAYTVRRIWKCKACNHQFSVTSGTIFASRKMPIRQYLVAIAIFVNAAKGLSALQLGRDLDVQYKTAFVLAHKLREAIGSGQADTTLSGHVEVDGAYFGGTVRQENRKEDRKDRRLAENQTGKRQVVVVMRERGGRTLPFVFRSEDQAIPTIRERVAPGSTVYADEAGSWDALHARFETKRINHQLAFSDDGACTNQAESYFSRLRRAEWGQHHHISGKYLGAYAREMAWREDTRRRSNGTLHSLAAAAALGHPVSRVWAGYWQRGRA
ncbi:IS1595 family transposase [Roseicella sp. DB1501]|uniref:IS1595 family transposase n=1 Tax=Roseicella sp. DB1501 TaxID=2730925 RepID=UPI001492C907|nr:IS1595 family transposase [Roseicella sp. DB1501]NOG71542.1 IS1595 family transposase [Roseicella sp. DB1501]